MKLNYLLFHMCSESSEATLTSTLVTHTMLIVGFDAFLLTHINLSIVCLLLFWRSMQKLVDGLLQNLGEGCCTGQKADQGSDPGFFIHHFLQQCAIFQNLRDFLKNNSWILVKTVKDRCLWVCAIWCILMWIHKGDCLGPGGDMFSSSFAPYYHLFSSE